MSVCLPAHTEHLGPHWTDSHEIWYVNIFRKSVKEIRVLLKSDKNNGYFTWRPMYNEFFLDWETFQTKFYRENQNAYFIFNNFFQKKRAVYKVMWKNMKQPCTPQMTIWRMSIACWITNVTNTHLECIILIVTSLQNYYLNSSQCYVITT